jgi:filamentous hemagglutinin
LESCVGDKVRVPSPSNIKDFVTLPRNQGYKNKYTDEIWKKSNTNHSGSVGGMI